MLGDPHSGSLGGVLAQLVRALRREAAEVEEAQRVAESLEALTRPGEISLVDVPVGDVEPRVPESEVLEVAGDEVDPPLIDVKAILLGDEAVPPKALGPPLEQVPGPLADRHEAEVVDAGQKDLSLVGEAAVSLHRRQRVRRQDHGVLDGQGLHVVDRCEDLDVRIDERRRCCASVEQRPQDPRLDRRGQLGDVVDRGHHREVVLQADLSRRQRDEQLRAEVLPPIRVVEHEDETSSPRMVTKERLSQDADIRQVVACGDGADVHWSVSSVASCLAASLSWEATCSPSRRDARSSMGSWLCRRLCRVG